jgi:hypothetical protein
VHRHWKQQGRHQDTFEDPKGADLRRFDKFKKRLHMTVIGHGILAGKYLAEYRDSLKQLFADVSGDRQSLGSFATSSQMRTDGRSYTW